MSLDVELGLRGEIRPLGREALMNVYYTALCIRKRAEDLLRPMGLSDVQLNVLLMLAEQGGEDGLSQSRISEMLLVNRANVTSLVDRMERDGLVERRKASDRRVKMVCLTELGRGVLERVRPVYMREISESATLDEDEQRELIRLLEKVRAGIRH